ncbi:unnamed protein product [Adineta steineri]|uniref:Uncharacterized protein n=1 Tax=Adineta steineri TaxID=433720 RepID=A0A814TUG6_9BILA|nr:unnamed protein product [Adineta steineri]CAF4043251.1 unnamed protein product [Adineta steineri]
MFLYSIFGISFFAYVRKSASTTDLFSCETFPNSMIILFQFYTTAGWLGLFQALTNDQQPDCDLTIKLSSNNEPPLRLSKLNQFLFVVMNLLICENDRMHCVDILNALTKIFLSKPDILGKNSERDDPPTDIKKDRRKVYYPVTTALEWQRETYLLKRTPIGAPTSTSNTAFNIPPTLPMLPPNSIPPPPPGMLEPLPDIIKTWTSTWYCFSELDNEKYFKFTDFETFEELFKTESGLPINQANVSPHSRQKFIKILETRALNNLDLKILTTDTIDILQHFIPTETETKAFTSYLSGGKPITNLSDEDRFLYGA